MSIEDEVNRRCTDGWLEKLTTDYPEGPITRSIYMTPHVGAKVLGPWGTKFEAGRWGIVRADLENFIFGELLTVPPEGEWEKTARLARLTSPPEEVWEIRCCDPKPGVRIFGRFATRNTFIALLWEYRETLGDRKDPAWFAIMKQCVLYWSRLFPHHDPVSQGDYPDAYLSDAIVSGD